jgi:hypothetical protein
MTLNLCTELKYLICTTLPEDIQYKINKTYFTSYVLKNILINNSIEIQTRNDEGELKFFNSLKSAFNYADIDKTVYKISYTIGKSRYRLLKYGNDWNNEPIILTVTGLDDEGIPIIGNVEYELNPYDSNYWIKDFNNLINKMLDN